MKYLTTEDVLLLHHLSVEQSGGSHGLRDMGLLDAAVHRPQATFGGQDLYPTLFAKAGALCHSLIKNHAFVDGNKRAAFLSAGLFLALNGYRVEASQAEATSVMSAVAAGDLSESEFVVWLRAHIRRAS